MQRFPDHSAQPSEERVTYGNHSGYKVVSKNDQPMFCPTQAPMGSHIAICLTESEWEQEQMGAFNWKVLNSPTPYTVTYRESH
jgi:hypothetical protein